MNASRRALRFALGTGRVPLVPGQGSRVAKGENAGGISGIAEFSLTGWEGTGWGELDLRTQIKQVFAKTGTHRQAELVVLLGKLI